MNNQEKLDMLLAQIQEIQAEVSRLQSESNQTELSGSVLGNINPNKENQTPGNTQQATQRPAEQPQKPDRETMLINTARESRTITQSEPLILFVGPASCGKSMVLMSLVEYLDKLSNPDYTIAPNEYYILHDPNYIANCDKFMQTLELNSYASTGKLPLDKTVNEILLDVKRGSSKGQMLRCFSMLEAPGEDFFDIGNPQKPYKSYIKNIIKDAPCPIYYVMLLDLHTPNNNFHDPNDTVRLAYERRLIEIINDGYQRKRGDRIILLYNKFDMHESAISDKAAMSKLFGTYYKRIKDTDSLYYKVLGERIYPQFEELPYISGEYRPFTDKNGNTYEIYDTTARVTRTVEDLWKKLQ